jgi:23S rRNA (adenine2503-C2)-methyltransferase
MLQLHEFYEFSPTRLESYLSSNGYPSVHLSPLLVRGYRELDDFPWLAKGLPKKLARTMADEFSVSKPKIVEQRQSEYDDSVKFVVELKDSWQIEMVLMPERGRLTLCLSSQVGCQQGCVFCHTGRMGLKRNLTAGEIIAQVILANKWIITNRPDWANNVSLTGANRVTNIVFMGMGEPLDNIENVITSIETMIHPLALGIAPRKITVSTAGHLPGLERLAKSGLKVGIALSLHATTNFERSRLMPINRRWNLDVLLEWFRKYTKETGRTVFIQYTVIANVNDSKEHADRLVTLLDGINAKVNLIPFNPIDPSKFQSPNPETLKIFCSYLYERKLRFMIRFSKGQDIAAACGQLVRERLAQENLTPQFT